MAQHTTHRILLVRPDRFRKNEQTAVNNYYQQDAEGLSAKSITEQAIQEFDNFVSMLHQNDIETIVLQDNDKNDTPDSVFPNNTISFHEGKIALYPMFATNRRAERKLIFNHLPQKIIENAKVIDYSNYEESKTYLEGTGCLILDRNHKLAYCSISPRASSQLVHQFCLDFGYQPIIFQAYQSVDGLRKPIYHTNVMLSIGQNFAVICLDSIDNIQHRQLVVDSLEKSRKEIIEICEAQVEQFAGNLLEVQSAASGDPVIVMSTQAFDSLTVEQRTKLERHGRIIHSNLDTIETCGGGSARCMMAEIF